MANIGWNVPGRSVEEGADNPVYVMGYGENQPLPPISPNLHTVSPSSVGTGYPNGETSLPYPTFPSGKYHAILLCHKIVGLKSLLALHGSMFMLLFLLLLLLFILVFLNVS